MPTYDYRCSACDFELELFQSITASRKRKCPECGKLKLKRIIGAGAGIIFKGSGFYETDYRSSEYTKAAEKEKQAASESSSKKSDSDTGKKKDATKTKKSTGESESSPSSKS